MELLPFNDFHLGWIPSNDLKQAAPGLLAMENITLDEHGALRLAKSSTPISDDPVAYDINSVYSANLNISNVNTKLRYIYANGTLARNYGSGASLTNFDLAVFSAATALRCRFTTALGHVFAIAGSQKYKDDGTRQSAIGINAPDAPAVSVNATAEVELDNQDGSGFYTNWTNEESSTYDDTAALLEITPDVGSNRAITQTIFAGTLDATNLGGTGNDTPEDPFRFFLKAADPSQVTLLRIEFLNETPPSGLTLDPAANGYYREWDYSLPGLAPASEVLSDVFGSALKGSPADYWGVTACQRSDFRRLGSDSTKTWANIKAVRFIVITETPTLVSFYGMKFYGGSTGNLIDTFTYKTVELDSNGNYLEKSLSSPASAAITAFNASIEVTPDIVDAQANSVWTYRKSTISGQYLRVNQQSGAYGFTPAAFDDNSTDTDLLEAAAADPLVYLDPYRTALPDDIVGMLWFADRMIYLNSAGFFPSYKLDPGSYDSRFVYELAGSSAEQCLFITKLDVGDFIVATTKDFYRVSGTFKTIVEGETTLLDVTIYPLSISDPAISHAFTELNGSIIYLSQTGLRSLSNVNAELINGPLDLLFRGESRYSNPAIALVPADAGMVDIVTSGKRLYVALQHSDSSQQVYVLTLDEPPTWRLLTDPVRCMVREEDGTIIFGAAAGADNYLKSLETGSGELPIYLKTPFSYNGTPNNRKDALSLTYEYISGELILEVFGLQLDGTIVSKQYPIINTGTNLVKTLDITSDLGPCLAYSWEISGITDSFHLTYLNIYYDKRPPLTNRVLIPGTDFGSAGQKQITAIPLRINLISNTVILHIKVDGVEILPLQSFSSADVITEIIWRTKDAIIGTIWEIEITGGLVEFYELGKPEVTHQYPVTVKRVYIAPNNFGHGGRKSMAAWPFLLNPKGGTITCKVFAGAAAVKANPSIPDQTFSGVDFIQTVSWFDNTGVRFLHKDWSVELTSNTPFEFYKALEPSFSHIAPVPVRHVRYATSNLGTAARKELEDLSFKANPINSTITAVARVDGTQITGPLQTFTTGDEIKTFGWLNKLFSIGVDWELELYSSGPMEFYEFLKPGIARLFPEAILHKILPPSNLGKPNKKKISVWPVTMDTLGSPVEIRVRADGVQLPSLITSSTEPRTHFWRNTQDFFAVDWGIEVFAINDNPFEFYKFHNPEILQILPMGKLIDQVGPLDFNASGLVFGMRLRVLTETLVVHYKVYDNDTLVYENDITTVINQDLDYIEKFPKGIDSSVCRIILTSALPFYRFSLEFKVRLTGHESEEKFIKVKDTNASN